MRRTFNIFVISAIAFLLGLGTITWLDYSEEQSEINHNQIYSNLHPPYIINNIKKEDNLIKVSNLEQEQHVKEILNHDPSVKLIFHNKQDLSHYYKKEVTVKFKEQPSSEQLKVMSEDIDGSIKTNYNTTYVFKSNSKETTDLVEYFSVHANVEYAEPNFILLSNKLTLPNDLYYQERYQWNLPMITTEEGWSKSRGVEEVRIAVIDTGVDLDHPDLKNRLVLGYNALEDNNNADDDNGHGTHVAGIIASETNNREGIAGVTWYNKIIPVKVMGKEGYGTTFEIAEGIIWAADNGADIINLSLGNYQPSTVLHDAIKYAYNKDIVLIAAAGNDNTHQPAYPAAYPEVLSVSAVSYNGDRAEFSNYGDYIDVTAPGVYIPSTYMGDNYASLSGTSMAAPHVAGLAGLIRSGNQTLSNKDVMKIIKASAYDLGEEGKDDAFGNGLIDINRALEQTETYHTPGRKIKERIKQWFQ